MTNLSVPKAFGKEGLCVGKVGLVFESWKSIPTDHAVELLLDLLLLVDVLRTMR